MFQELWERPNLVLRYGSFDPTKRAEALARAGELGAAVRALTSEGVLEAKDHTEKLKALHPEEDPLMAPDRLIAQEDTLHASFTSADFRYVVKKAKLKRAADALGWRADIKQMNSEAVNAICKLCKRTAANPEFIPDQSSDHTSLEQGLSQ